MIDAVVVGAGVAGLACARALGDAGLEVALVEARTRIGGRVHTREVVDGVPVEGGAEFVHGRSPALWRIFQEAKIRVGKIEIDHHLFDRSQLQKSDGLWNEMMQAIGEAGMHERTVAQMLDEPAFRRRPRLRAFIKMYVEGFHAANVERASVRAIWEQGEASEDIDGEALHRVCDGYHRVPEALAQALSPRLNTVVTRVKWRRSSVTLECRSQAGTRLDDVVARRAVLTLPVPILQKLPFSPSLSTVKRRAIAGLELGPVVKVQLRFSQPIWKRPIGFLHVIGAPLPTFWTVAPFELPMLVGWAAGPVARALPDEEEAILDAAARTLCRALGVSRREYEAKLAWWCVTDWRKDRFAGGGAYSWVPVGHDGLQEALAAPVENTLFFAGEATHPTQNGTVHGAIETGLRAANELLKHS